MYYNSLRHSRSLPKCVLKFTVVSISWYYFIVEKVLWIRGAGRQLWAVRGSCKCCLTEGVRGHPGLPLGRGQASLPPAVPRGLLPPAPSRLTLAGPELSVSGFQTCTWRQDQSHMPSCNLNGSSSKCSKNASTFPFPRRGGGACLRNWITRVPGVFFE